MKSDNDTWRGDRRVKREPLTNGNTIRFGAAEFRVELPPSLASASSPAGSSDPTVIMTDVGVDARPSRFVYAWLASRDGFGRRIVVDADKVRTHAFLCQLEPTFERLHIVGDNIGVMRRMAVERAKPAPPAVAHEGFEFLDKQRGVAIPRVDGVPEGPACIHR